MLGNSSLGALIYGKDKLTVSLDLVNLWDKRFPSEFKDENFNFAYLSKNLKENYQEARRLFDQCYCHPYPTKINAALMEFSLPVDDSSTFALNYDDGRFSFENPSTRVEGYLDANKDVLVIHGSGFLPHSFSLSPYFYKSVEEGGLGYPDPSFFEEGEFDGFVQRMYGNFAYHAVCCRVRRQGEETLYISVAKGKNPAKTMRMLKNYARNEEKYLKNHLLFWKRYYEKSAVNIPDSKLSALYQKGLYFFGANSYKNYPLTLQGVWTMNNGKLPPWKSDYHNDINVEMTYDACLKNGRAQGLDILTGYLYEHKKDFEEFASSFMKTPGLLIPGVMSQEAKPLGGWPQYALSPAVSIWALSPLDNRYQYSRSKPFLSHVCYPFFKETEECIFPHLEKKGGVYQLPFHSSPEFYEDDERSLFKEQTNFELTMLRYLYSKLVEYSKALGLPYAHYHEVLSSLPSYYRDEEGCLLIAPGCPFDHSHRHFSHMLMYKNLEMINPYKERVTIRKDIDKLLSFSTQNWVGFSFTEMSSLLSYIHDGEGAYKHLQIFEEAFVHPNGFHMNNDYKGLGYSSMDCYVMTLEANMGFVRAVEDMLLQDCFGIVSLFPAVPASFLEKGVSFKDLRLKGGHRISAELKGKIVRFEIDLLEPDTIKLENRFGKSSVFEVDGIKKNFQPKKDGLLIIKGEKKIAYEGLFE